MTEDQRRHASLDVAMANFHLDTHKLYSETPALELVIWLNERAGMAEWENIRQDVMMLVSLASIDLSPAQMSIMRLAEWSYEHLRPEVRLASE